MALNSVASPTLAPKADLVKEFPKKSFKGTLLTAIAAFLVVASGVATGYFLSGKTLGGGQKEAVPGVTTSTKEAGLADEATFRDSAEGVLEVGGVDGEGTHHLVRDGGESQYVYLTSTVIDLESFVGKKVTVWGETISARKAGWLMDVGKLKVSE
jgi:hypothetical protein